MNEEHFVKLDNTKQEGNGPMDSRAKVMISDNKVGLKNLISDSKNTLEYSVVYR